MVTETKPRKAYAEQSHLYYISHRKQPRVKSGRSITLDTEREQQEPLLFFPHHLDLRDTRETEEPPCKFCNGNNIRRYSKYKTVVYWWCRDCRRKFANNGATLNMVYPSYIVQEVITKHLEGNSTHQIRRIINSIHKRKPALSTIWEWINKFEQMSVENAKNKKMD